MGRSGLQIPNGYVWLESRDEREGEGKLATGKDAGQSEHDALSTMIFAPGMGKIAKEPFTPA
tara:strand:- start:1103 stop:1288 length:186 start_codon:yes stop_codon:yes gene_type:complete